MNLIKYLLLSLLFLTVGMHPASGQDHINWWNPESTSFPVIGGKGWHEGLKHFYNRLPAKAKDKVRKPVWHLSQESAGLMIKFRTKAADIYVRYEVGGELAFPHMPATGKSGVDLYAVGKSGRWQWAGGNFNFTGDTIKYHFASLPNDYTREYHLYLPLYNNVEWLKIGVPDSAEFTPLPVSSKKPIVVYGTSIAQGACATRPGMAWTAILGRSLHRPVINLGFSGNGRLEKSVVSLLTELDPKIYVVDCLPNMTRFPTDTVKARLTKTIKTLRKQKPEVPVLVVEDADASIDALNRERNEEFDRVNKAAEAVFKRLKASGMQRIYLLTADDIGLGIESTVAGIHPNDYGMIQYAKAYEKIIREILY